MGQVNCPVHGPSALIETCVHVARQIADGDAPVGRRLGFLDGLFICDDCVREYGFERAIDLEPLSRELTDANRRWVASDPGDMSARKAFRDALERIEPYEAAFSPAYGAMTHRRIFCSQCFTGFEGRRS